MIENSKVPSKISRPYLPADQAQLAQQVPARFQLHVFVALITDFAHFEGGAHLAVYLVLLRRHLNPSGLRVGVQCKGQVHVLVAPVRVQVEALPVSVHLKFIPKSSNWLH